LGTLRVLEAMREFGKKDIKMYNASTSEIFGKMV
jgi:GDP-D-mannose dehydratase